MKRRRFLKTMGLGAAEIAMGRLPFAKGESARKPNIIIIMADDLGYADTGFTGCKDIPTPNIDSIALGGVRFTNGCVSHPYCSPSRAGLLVGRYQHRFGHECNPAYDVTNPKLGLPVSEILLSDVLQKTDFIRRYKDKPFFLYLAYNAPHLPLQAPAQYTARFKVINEKNRRLYAAMTSAMDNGIGHVLSVVLEYNLEKDTLIFFLSDNGGDLNWGGCNHPLRSGKGSLYEGGIRVPYERLFWRVANGSKYAVRESRYKLVANKKTQKKELFDLLNDPREIKDISWEKPGEAQRLNQTYIKWRLKMIAPLWPNPKEYWAKKKT